ncbi:MAG TPA: serine/threonine protein kinase [Burkholderiaceae bacterium]
MQRPTAGPETPPFAALTPDVILNAVDSVGLCTSGRLLALNSYENRVFQVGLEPPRADAAAGDLGPGSAEPESVVVKFYRPARWPDEAIREEHAFEAELAASEVPAVPPLVLGGATLHRHADFRFAVFPRRGGRAPELSDPAVRRRIGRFIGRLHEVGAANRYRARPALDIETFAIEPSRYLAGHGWLPPELLEVYRGVVGQALDGLRAAFDRAGPVHSIRLHGDCHEGNLLWSEAGPQPGPHFVDFDDSRMGPAIQDLWMLLSGDRESMSRQLGDLLTGYEDFAAFDRRELHLVEALRTLRLIHYSAWIARRWDDPAFPAAFPWFDTPRYWEARILELREQVAAMQEPALELPRWR